MDSSSLEQCLIADSCEHGNETSGCINGGEFIV